MIEFIIVVAIIGAAVIIPAIGRIISIEIQRRKNERGEL